MKKLIAIALAASLTVQSARASELPPMTPKQQEKFCKAFIGADDLLWIWIASIIGQYIFSEIRNAAKREKIKELEAKAKKQCS